MEKVISFLLTVNKEKKTITNKRSWEKPEIVIVNITETSEGVSMGGDGYTAS